MKDVYRLSKMACEELEIFKNRYLTELKVQGRKSQLCKDLYNEHLNYTDSQWLEFAIRVACNRYNADGV